MNKKNEHIDVSFFQGLLEQAQMGMLIIDSSHSVIKANAIAKKYLCRIAAKMELGYNEVVESLISYASKGVGEENGCVRFSSGDECYQLGLISYSISEEPQRMYYFLHITRVENRLQDVILLQAARELYSLSRRETEVLGYLIEGKSDRDIADAMDISISTVKAHDRSIYQKMDVSGRKRVINKLITNCQPQQE